ncbi:MAG: heavy metal translocating P-type ATPase [Hyphomicrobium sp.]|uniref:heavy metal translocating P-type ATPase n=1 Tax=Hyphomicrobium sp. TaxID=82 RepID=UPI0025BDACC0|nr:heavy metal translocating P-type ATPase [Hyphomicrobium sp.]MBZ0209245.1 heavy metal translocating P-type ATPase [Hyphomicrobium sp.]
MVTGGWFFGREALEELLYEREIGIELLMTTAALTAAAMGLPGEGATLAFLYSISEAAEGYTEDRTRSAIRALMKLTPKVALVRRDGHDTEVSVEELVPGDIFIVRPGEAIATDGTVRAGESSVNQAPVTGESVPVAKRSGDTVFAGTLNGEATLEVEVSRTFAENTISRIIKLVEEAQERKGTAQRFIERFGRRYSPMVLALGIGLALLVPLAFGGEWREWITRATVFIVAAAPCALVISIPITMVAALGTAARHGVLVKGGIYMEELAKIRVVAFDKTGTITRGEPDVTDIVLLPEPVTALTPDEHALLSLAASLEIRSEHPIARAIVRAAHARGLRLAAVEEFRALPGAGGTARLADGSGISFYIGSPRLFETRLRIDLTPVAAQIARLQADGKTVVVIGTSDAPLGLIAVQDTMRPNAPAAISALRAAGISRTVMLTGDAPAVAQLIAARARIDDVFANLAPEDKVSKVRELASHYRHVAMVGDGINDAPALAEANVGIAMGTAGTDVALETADVALMADNLEKITEALRLARRADVLVRQNLVLSIAIITALVAGAVAGFLSLPVAVLAHEITEFLVIANGLRMLRA